MRKLLFHQKSEAKKVKQKRTISSKKLNEQFMSAPYDASEKLLRIFCFTKKKKGKNIDIDLVGFKHILAYFIKYTSTKVNDFY